MKALVVIAALTAVSGALLSASCDDQSLAAPLRSCSIVHVEFIRTRFELRVNETPAAVANAVNARAAEGTAAESEQLVHLGGDSYLSERWPVVAIEGCAGAR